MTTVQFDRPLSDCPLCGSANIKKYLTDYKCVVIFKCRSCSLQFMNPQYSDAYLKEFYSKYQNGDFSHHEYKDNKLPRKTLHKLNLEEIEKYVQPGRFLSIGSGNAYDVMEASKRGWDAEGLDLDAHFVEQLSKNFDVKMNAGDFLEHIYPENSFNCIYMNQVLEHSKQPGRYIKKINKLLVKGGILYLACPNISSLSSKIKRMLEKTGLKKDIANYYDTWQHLIYFSPGFLKKHLESNYPFKVLVTTNDLKIDKLSLKPKKNLFSFPYKSSFRMLIKKI